MYFIVSIWKKLRYYEEVFITSYFSSKYEASEHALDSSEKASINWEMLIIK